MFKFSRTITANHSQEFSCARAPILSTHIVQKLSRGMIIMMILLRAANRHRPATAANQNALSWLQRYNIIASSSSRTLHIQRNEAKTAINQTQYNASSLFDSRGFHLNFDTLHEMTHNATLLYNDNPLFGSFHQDSTFHWMTYSDFGHKVRQCRSLLLNLGVTPYSKVAIISNNRVEWAVIAAATYSINAALVPMYEAQLPKDWTYILNDSECRVLFCSTEEIYLKVKKEVMANAPLVSDVLCLDAHDVQPNSFHGAMSRMEETSNKVVEPPMPDDLANLIYTSGTTGKPKGVELVHSNQVSNIKAGRDMVVEADAIRSSDRSLAFLPWAHSYGQTCELWYLMSQGASMGICRGIPHILEDLQLVQPTLLYAVPTLYKRVHDGVINLMSNVSPIKQGLMRTALRLGKANAAHKSGIIGCNGVAAPPLGFIDRLKFKILDDVVLSKIRGRFGNHLRVGFVAGAACPKEIVEFMDCIGIPICEGYGLTETSPVISMNVLNGRKAGSVGRILNGVQVWIVDPDGNPLKQGEEGEICCTGPNVMRGYHNNPDATNEVITLAPDGISKMFHTGDLGKLDSDGFLSVTGRLKELYKLENGKYVCPTPIEQSIAMSRFISQVVVHGANRPYNIALIVPDWVAIRSELGIAGDISEEELVNEKKVRGLISEEIKLNCYNVKRYEVPRAWLITPPFTAGNNMLTPKMSIRRHVVIKEYEEMITDLYDDNDVNDGFQIDSQKAA